MSCQGRLVGLGFVVALVVLGLSEVAYGTTESTEIVQAGGANLAKAIYRIWTVAFSQALPRCTIVYTSTNHSAGLTSLASGDYIFSGGSSTLNRTALPQLYYFPVVFTPLVVVYSQPFPALRLDADLIGKIFIGDIHTWNDTAIQAINPGLALPNTTISVILRDGSAGTTSSFTTVLSAISPSFSSRVKSLNVSTSFNNWGPVAPKMKAVNPNFHYTLLKGETEVIFGVVLSQTGSVSFGPLSFALNLAMNYAWMKNGYGNVINAEREQVLQLPPNITMPDDKSFNVYEKPIINRKLPDAWPMVAMTYINLNTTTNDRCNLRQDAAKFIMWVLTSDSAYSLAALNGFINIPPEFKSLIIPNINNIKCSGESLLSYKTIPKENTGTIGALVVSLILGVLIIVVFVLILPTYGKRYIAKILATFLCLASVINYFSPIFWFLEASSTTICQVRLWIFALSNSLLMSVVFNTTLQYYFIKITIGDKSRLNTNFPFLSSSLGIIGGFLAIQIVILIIWTAVDPFRTTVLVTNGVDYVGVNTCNSSYLSTWLIIECVYFLILLIFGIFCVIYTWKILTSKSRWLLMCIYNSVIVFAICIVYFTLQIPSDVQVFNIITIFVIVITIGFDTAVFLPKVIETKGSSSRSNSKKTASKEKGSSLHSLQTGGTTVK